MKKKGFRKKLAAGVMALALCVSGMNASLAADPPDNSVKYNNKAQDSAIVKDGVYIYDSSDPLFAATAFHIFAEDEASITAHCNGNIATKFLSQGSNSGSNKLYDSQRPEYNYIRKFQDGSVVRFGPETLVVYGTETDVYLRQNSEIYIDMFDANGNESSIQKMDISKDRVFTEAGSEDSARFINFNEEFRKLSILSYNLAKEPTTTGLAINQNVIDMTGKSGTSFINVSADDLKGGSALVIDKTDFKSGQALVINVDMGTHTNYTLPFTQVLLKDTTGTSFGSGEDKGTYTGYGNVLWNFYGRTANGTVTTYTGKITTCSEFKGTILAPDAEIYTASSNQDGNFIGREVHLGGGETHRWDFGGALPTTYDYSATLGSLNAVATVEGTATGVANVEIYVYEKGDENSEPVAKIITDETGKTTTVGNLPMGEYTGIVKQVPYGYEAVKGTDTVNINADDVTFTLEYELKQVTTATPDTGYIKVVVVDADTGDYIENVTVNVADSGGNLVQTSGGSSTYTTDVFGTTKTEPIEISDTEAKNQYKVIVTNVPTGYDKPSTPTEVELTTKNPNEVIIKLSKTTDNTPKGSIQIKVYEKGTTKPVEGAVVSIVDKDTHIIKEVEVVTGEDGTTEVVGNLPLSTDTITMTYTNTMISIPAGYELAAGENKIKEVTLTESNKDVVIVYELEKIKGSMQVIVVDTEGNKVKGANVKVTQGTTQIGGLLTTDTNGETPEVYNLEVDDDNDGSPVYKAEVVGVPSGYKIVAATASKEGTVESIDEVLVLELEVVKLGKLDVTVQEKDSDVKVKDAIVEISDANGNFVDKVTTNSTGHFVINDLEPGTYTITTTAPSGYDEPDSSNSPQTATVVANGTASVVVKLDKTQSVTPPTTGSINMLVKYPDDAGVGNVTATVTCGGTTVGTLTTADSGSTIGQGTAITGLALDKEYTVTVNEASIPKFYTLVKPTDPNAERNVKSDTITASDPNKTVVFELKHTGILEVIVKEDGTDGDVIPGAIVDIVDGNNNPVASGVITDSNGKVVIKDLDTGDYTIIVKDVPDEYKMPTVTETTENVVAGGIATKELYLTKDTTPAQTGILDVYVKTEGGTAVEGVKFTVTCDGAAVTGGNLTSSAAGLTAPVDNLEIGKTYTVTIDELPEFYALADGQTESQTETIAGTTKVTKTFILKQTGTLEITITDADDNTKKIEGAKVTVTNKVTNEVIGTDYETDKDGKIVIPGLSAGTYTATTTYVPDGYKAPVPTDGVVEVAKKKEIPLEVSKRTDGAMVVLVTDVNGTPISGVKVTITKGSTQIGSELTTDNNGKTTVIPDLTIGETYTATLDTSSLDDYYVLAESYDFKVKDIGTDNDEINPAKVEFKVKKTGNLEVTIKDRNTQELIEGAKVTVTNTDTNTTLPGEYTTDANGKVVIPGLDGGNYVVNTVYVPNGYTAPDPEPAEVVVGETKPANLFVEKTTGTTTQDPSKGSLQVQIKDRNTGDPIPGATVVIKNPDGSIKETVTTNGNGMTPVVGGLTVGATYTVETTKVPDGYTAPIPATQKINGTTTEVVKLEVGRDSGVQSSVGSLFVIITDKNTGAVIPNATVEIINSAGEKLHTVKTDANGSITINNLKPDTYTIKTTAVPEGYTAPDAETAKVAANARTDAHLYVVKGASSSNTPATDKVVQTGDESNVHMASVLAIVALAGIVIVSIKKRRDLI